MVDAKTYMAEWYQQHKDHCREYRRKYWRKAHRPKISWRDTHELLPILRRVYDDDPEIAVYKMSDELIFIADGHVTIGYYFYEEDRDGFVKEGFCDAWGMVRDKVPFWSLLPEVPT